MLILSRKVGEKIVIGDGIIVVVSRVSGDRVTLGFEAPPEVRILRGELRPFDNPVERNPRAAPGAPARNETRRDRTFEPRSISSPR
jgi:carbon storage regulator